MKAVRHKVATQKRVIELYEAGWRRTEIRQILGQEGRPVPSPNTIWVWTRPEKAAAAAAHGLLMDRRRRAENATFRWPGAAKTVEWRWAFMRRLRAEGVSYSAIVKVMRVLFGEELSEDTVRYQLLQDAATAREAS